MRFSSYFTVPLLLLTIAAPAAARQAAQPAPGEALFNVFLRGNDSGREQVNVAQSGTDWIITSSGRFGDLTINRFEMRYGADWQPIELKIEAAQGTRKIGLATSFSVTSAINEISQNGATTAKTDQISARTIVLPNNFYASYEALAARLAGVEAGAELPVYVAPQAEIKLQVKGVTAERVQTPSGPVDTRKYDITFQNPGNPVSAVVTIDARARLARLDIPAVGLAVVRSDLTSVAVRTETLRNPTDSDVTIPTDGFNLAGTITTPPDIARLRAPAIVLVAGSGQVDRDETVAGIPIFAQLAGALAQRGFVVVRYDKRGVGQSGGRTETAALPEYADDLIAIVKWLRKREDVDPRRIAVAGHSEGGAVAMIAATREDKITSLVLMGTPGTTGAELILEQQRHQLDLLKTPDAERQEKIALQQKIQAAVTSDKGDAAWEGIPPALRRQADTPWFRSFLLFDPARIMPKVRQPILIVQGDLDVQVPPKNADRLAELARGRKKAAPVEVTHLPGLNHLFVPAATGEVQEYATLKEKAISPRLAETIADWMKK